MKVIIRDYMKKSCDHLDALPFMLHDFGARGATSNESAVYGGAAHLINFMGSDNLEAVSFINDTYNDGVVGYSIPATEHSTMTAWGKDHEAAAFRNMFDNYATKGAVFSIVSDSYDIYNCLKTIVGEVLHDEVEQLGEIGAKLVIRPDSGDIIETPIEVFNILAEKFGTTRNSKGYLKLPPYLGIIQGDGLNRTTLKALCHTIVNRGIALDNFAFGMGGGLLQGVTRDTYSFAMKCSAAEIDGKWVDVYKDPVTASSKQSKRGILGLYTTEKGKYYTAKEDNVAVSDSHNLLKLRYKDGLVYNQQEFRDIRALAEVKD
jgi:nicotinamide phosphoribosyltransferase